MSFQAKFETISILHGLSCCLLPSNRGQAWRHVMVGFIRAFDDNIKNIAEMKSKLVLIAAGPVAIEMCETGIL